jgi:hypothetical protein
MNAAKHAANAIKVPMGYSGVVNMVWLVIIIGVPVRSDAGMSAVRVCVDGLYCWFCAGCQFWPCQ